MSTPALTLALAIVLAIVPLQSDGRTPRPAPTPVYTYDVLVSAGHEGRPQSCKYFPRRKCNMGALGELAWTPVVADEVARILRSHGYRVAREPADFAGLFHVRVAVFIHFDGITPICTSGASIGYHTPASRPAADLWRAEYSRYIPFRFKPDNFTRNLSDYYGFRQVRAQDAALVLELGEISCPAQRAWLAPRLRWEGQFIAHFISQVAGLAPIPEPSSVVDPRQ